MVNLFEVYVLVNIAKNDNIQHPYCEGIFRQTNFDCRDDKTGEVSALTIPTA